MKPASFFAKLKILVFSFFLLTILPGSFSYCQQSKDYQAIRNNFPSIKILPAIINTKFDEFSPVVDYKRNILYFSLTKSKEIDKSVSFFEEYSHIYYSEKKGNTWTNPLELGTFNIPHDNNSVCGISNSYDRIFLFTFADGGDIFYSDKKNNGWTSPKRLGKNINMTQYMESDITMNSKNDEIYFSRRDLKNNLDYNIFKTININGKWQLEVKLDSNINSSNHDRTPFIDSSSRYLFFSSNGHNSLGGYDIFVSKIINGQLSKPINLGYPINTIYDDGFFSISNDLNHAFFASNREDQGNSDIYEIDFTDINFEKYIDWKSRINLIDSIIKQSSDSSLFFIKGIYEINTGDYYNGFSDFLIPGKIKNKSIQMANPFCSDKDLYIYFNKFASAQFLNKDYLSAIKTYSNMAIIFPNDTIALFNRGLAYFYNKEIELSLKDISSSIALGSNSAQIFKKQFLDDETISAYFNRKAIQNYKECNFSLAIEYISKVIEIVPNSIVAIKIRAEIEQKTGDNEGACRDWLKAFTLGDVASEELMKKNCK